MHIPGTYISNLTNKVSPPHLELAWAAISASIACLRGHVEIERAFWKVAIALRSVLGSANSRLVRENTHGFVVSPWPEGDWLVTAELGDTVLAQTTRF